MSIKNNAHTLLTSLEARHFLQPEQDTVEHTEHRKDSAHNGAELRHKVQKGHANAAGFNHERGQLVHEENTWQNRFLGLGKQCMKRRLKMLWC